MIRLHVSQVSLLEEICDKCPERIAQQGFVVLVPDLYRGELCDTAREASHHMTDLDWLDAARDVQSAVDFLKSTLKCHKVGVVGFCVGGALVIIVARLEQSLIATYQRQPKYCWFRRRYLLLRRA